MSGQISVTAGQVPELIKKNLRHPRIVTALCGDNGLGKSEAAMQGVEQYAEEIGMTCVDTREQVPNAAKNELGVTHMNFANYQPEDLQFPDVKERIYRHVISDILPFANSRWESGGYTRDTYQGVLICDEVGKNKSLFNNLSQWVCEGAWGNGEKLPAGLRIIFTTNDATHNAVRSLLVRTLCLHKAGRPWVSRSHLRVAIPATASSCRNKTLIQSLILIGHAYTETWAHQRARKRLQSSTPI